MTISVRGWGLPSEAYAATGTSLTVAPQGTAAALTDDLSVLTVQASPVTSLIQPPAGWRIAGSGVINTHPNRDGPDSIAAIFVKRGNGASSITPVVVERPEGPGWAKANSVTYQKDTPLDWSYSVETDDYTYGAASVEGTGLFLTLEANTEEPAQSYFSDEFTELDTSVWELYDGPGRGGVGLRLPDNVSAVAGVLTIVGTPSGYTGGVRLKNHSQQYGRWEFRARVRPGAAYYRPVIRLWAVDGGMADDNPNGSVNLLEVVRSASRSVNTFSANYNDGAFKRESADLALDLTQWHVYVLVWEPGGLFFYVDDQLAWANYSVIVQPGGPVDVCILLEYYANEIAVTNSANNYLAASFEVDSIKQLSLQTTI